MTVVLNAHVTGIAEALSQIKGLQKKLDSGEISDKIAEHIKDLAIKFCPRSNINHKHLDESIYLKKIKNIYQLVADKPYATYVEYGTRFIPVGEVENPFYYISTGGKFSSRPFLRPAIYKGIKDAQRIVDEIVEKIKRGR